MTLKQALRHILINSSQFRVILREEVTHFILNTLNQTAKQKREPIGSLFIDLTEFNSA